MDHPNIGDFSLRIDREAIQYLWDLGSARARDPPLAAAPPAPIPRTVSRHLRKQLFDKLEAVECCVCWDAVKTVEEFCLLSCGHHLHQQC